MGRVKDYDGLWDLIEQHEGRRAKVYLDTAGHPTVGIGFNLDRADAGAKLSALGLDPGAVREGAVTLTDDQVDELFEPDLATAIDELKGVAQATVAQRSRRAHRAESLLRSG